MFKVKIEGTIIDDLKERLSIANNRKSIIQQIKIRACLLGG